MSRVRQDQDILDVSVAQVALCYRSIPIEEGIVEDATHFSMCQFPIEMD